MAVGEDSTFFYIVLVWVFWGEWHMPRKAFLVPEGECHMPLQVECRRGVSCR